jgi:hypothetical protein
MDGSVKSKDDVERVNVCEKPVPLLFDMYSNMCSYGTLVSLTTGSGNMCTAASVMGWTAIGFEKSLQQFGTALCRLSKDDVAGYVLDGRFCSSVLNGVFFLQRVRGWFGIEENICSNNG